MRLILAQIIFAFDMELADEDEDGWADQKLYLLWERPSLQLYLKPVQ